MASITLKNGQLITIRLLNEADGSRLMAYVTHLSAETRQRFAPHSFDKATIEAICAQINGDIVRYIAQTPDGELAAYMLVKIGVLPKDAGRMQSYGLPTDEQTDCTFAPSVSDRFQGSGLGSIMFEYILADLLRANKKRIILWGGVQAGNEQAIRYYQKLGFTKVGSFDRKGLNYDMIKEIG